MAQKRTHFRKATLEASSNPHKNILAKRLVMAVRYVATNHKPLVLSMQAEGIRESKY